MSEPNLNSSYSFDVPKQRTDIITDTELFNSDALMKSASSLDDYFSRFADTLTEINELVNSQVNASPDECIFGNYAEQLRTMWNENVPTFGDFKENFEAWSRAVTVIASRNINTEDIVKAIYNNRTTGADLTASDGRSIVDVRQEIMLNAADKSENNSGGGNTYTYYNENGELTMRFENADGDVFMQHTKDSHGNLISTVCTDAYGNTSKIEFVRDADGKLVEKNIAYYDANGNKLNVAPDTFNKNGYLISNKTGVAKGAWTSYEDAVAEGHSDILTEEEFAARNNVDGYVCSDASGNRVTVKTYQEYLDVMQGKYGDSSTQVSIETDLVTPTSGEITPKSESVTVSSGQKVNVDGKEYYYLMTDSQGKNYYTLSNDSNAQVYVDGENGPEIYTQYGGDVVSKGDFISSRKNNLDYSWSATYNNGTSPFDSVGSTSTVSFDGISENTAGNAYVVNNVDTIKENAVPLSSINFGEVKIGNEKLPDVIYVAPGDDVRWDPFDFLDMKDIHIEGGNDGKYLVLDPNSNTYYTMNSDGTYHADGGNDYSSTDISYDRLISGDTDIDAD